MEVAEPYMKWRQPDTEEGEFVEQLLERRPKRRMATATSFDSDGGESGVSEVSEIEDRKLEMETDTEMEAGGGEIGNGLKEEERGVMNVEEMSGMNVYFDKTSGIWKCHHCTWTYKIASPVAEHYQSPKHSHLLGNVNTTQITSNCKGAKFSNGTSEVQSRSTKLSVSEDGSMTKSSEVSEENVTIPESHTITRTHDTTIKNAKTEYHSSQPVQASGSHNPRLYSTADGNGQIKKDNSEELGVLLEDDPEPTDYDVEGVLKKQETHDLICPNCNACITRRVILRKRKRVIKDVQLLNSKRDRIEETGHSEISPGTERDTVDERSADMVVDHAADGQNDVITCWSCFSLLIPLGKGFKLFKVFGGRKQPEAVALSASNRTPLLSTENREISAEEGNAVDSMQLASGIIADQKSSTGKKGGEFKLFNSYGNSRDDKLKSSHQMSTSETSQVTTSSKKTFNAQGDTLSNHVEVNTKTSSSSFYNNGLPSVVTDYLATHTELAGEGQKIEAGSGFKDRSSTMLHSHDEYQINMNDKPGTEFDSFKDRTSFKFKDIAFAVQGSTLFDKLDTDLGKGSNHTTLTSRGDTLSNNVEVNTKTSSSSFYNNGLPSLVTDYLATHTELTDEGQKIEAGSGFQNGSSTILHSHDEYQMDINDKPGTEFNSFKDRTSFKSKDIVSAVQGSTLLDKLDTDLGKGSNHTTMTSKTSYSSFYKNGLPAAVTDYLGTHTELAGKGQKIEAGSGFQNGSSTMSQSHDEYQIDINDKPGTDFNSFKDRTSFKFKDISSAIQGSAFFDKLGTDIGKGSNHTTMTSRTSSSSFYNNRLLSAVTDYLAAHAELVGKGQKIEAGSRFQNGSSTILHSRDEYQMEINDKPGIEFDSFKDRTSFKSKEIASAVQGSTLLDKLDKDLGKGSNYTTMTSKDDVRISIENGVKQEVSSRTENASRDIVIPRTETQAHEREQVARVGEARDLDILKSIVYGGLIESITSLGVVSSAAGAGTSTLSILALGLANLIGGLILIFHNIKDLYNSPIEGPTHQVDRYYNSLGNRNNFKLHIMVAILSFIIFGSIPILTYGFSFLKSDNSDYKSLAVLGTSIICITLLSTGKAHVKNPPRTASTYLNSILYYLSLAISASGLSYLCGKLLQELIAKTSWFDTTPSLNSILLDTTMASHPTWGSY